MVFNIRIKIFTCCLLEDNLPYIDNEDELEIIISGKVRFYSEIMNIVILDSKEGYYK